jgi:hypothetical protein
MFGTLALALPALLLSIFLPSTSPLGSEHAVACSGLVPHLPIRTSFPSVATYHVTFFCCLLWLLMASFMDIWACTHCESCGRHARTAGTQDDVFAPVAAVRGAVLAMFIMCVLLVHIHFDAASSILQLSEWVRIQAALDTHTTWVYFPLAAATCDGRLPVAVVNATFMPPAVCDATCSILLQHATLCCLPWTPTTAPHAAYATHVLRSRASIGLYVLFAACQFSILAWTVAGCVIRKRRRAAAVDARIHPQNVAQNGEQHVALPAEAAGMPLLALAVQPALITAV